MVPIEGAADAAARRILDALDADALVADLSELVRIGPVTGTAAESAAQRYLAGRLSDAGLAVDLWSEDIDGLRSAAGSPGDETDRAELLGLAASTGPERPGTILVGHVDVVPNGDPETWSADPTGAAISGDLLYGRGASDMLSGLAVNVAVARAVVASGVRLAAPLAVHSVASEEDGGLGAFATLRRGHVGDAAVITEPTDGLLVVASAGALTFRLEVPGRAAHGSNRLDGISALTVFERVHRALRELEERRNSIGDARFGDNRLPYALSIGVVRAGDWASTVPDRLVADGRYGVRIGEDPAAARAEFEQVVAGLGADDPWLRDHPVVVTWPGGQFASGVVDEAHPLITEVSDAIQAVRGITPNRVAAPYGSDQRHYTAAGVPTVLYGPGALADAHAPDEKVSLSDTVAVARTLAVLVARRCGAS